MNLTLLVYCPELDPATKEHIGYEIRPGVGGTINRVPLEARYPYFGEGFVSADAPRDSAYSADVVAACKGWGLADQQGNVLGRFESAKDADNARKNATLELKVNVPEAVAAG